MANESHLSISDLRAKAAFFRDRADKIDSAIDTLIALAQTDFSDVPAIPSAQPRVKERGTGGKPLGTVTTKWASVLRRIAGDVQECRFGHATAIAAAKDEIGRDMRTADMKRQLEPYVAAGYLTQPEEGVYYFTPEGFAKIGFTPNNRLNLGDAPNENGEAEASPDARGVAPPLDFEPRSPEQPTRDGSFPAREDQA